MKYRSLFFIVLSLCILAAFPSTSLSAKTTATPSTTPLPIVKVETMMKKTSQYLLPYPGLLPGHPLYGIKQLRDTILEKLIVDPLRKSEFYLLQADKFLNTSVSLHEKGLTALSAESIGKSAGYLLKSYQGFLTVKGGGREIPGHIVERLQNATEKHAEVLTDLLAKASDDEKVAVLASLAVVADVSSGVGKLK